LRFGRRVDQKERESAREEREGVCERMKERERERERHTHSDREKERRESKRANMQE